AAGKDLAILSKKLATIIVNAPVEFHEEDFRVREMNKEVLRDVFAELEFKTLGKRVLGEEFAITVAANKDFIKKEQPVGVQTDLFGNVIEAPPEPAVTVGPTNGSDTGEAMTVSRNAQN